MKETGTLEQYMPKINQYLHECNVTFEELVADDRRSNITACRYCLAATLRLYGFTYQEIAKLLNKKSHSPVSSGIRSYYDRLISNDALACSCERFIRKIFN